MRAFILQPISISVIRAQVRFAPEVSVVVMLHHETAGGTNHCSPLLTRALPLRHETTRVPVVPARQSNPSPDLSEYAPYPPSYSRSY